MLNPHLVIALSTNFFRSSSSLGQERKLCQVVEYCLRPNTMQYLSLCTRYALDKQLSLESLNHTLGVGIRYLRVNLL